MPAETLTSLLLVLVVAVVAGTLAIVDCVYTVKRRALARVDDLAARVLLLERADPNPRLRLRLLGHLPPRPEGGDSSA